MNFKINFDRYEDKLITTWIPRRCLGTGKRMFLKPAYRIAAYYQPKAGKEIKYVFYLSTSEWLMVQLRTNSQ